MLSILIPTYNYEISPLITALHKQCSKLKIAFEIIVGDDASTQFVNENQQIIQLDHCFYLRLENNLGRTALRNFLAKKAYYDHILFLDADVMPKSIDFIKMYCNQIKHLKNRAIFGGYFYTETSYKTSNSLRFFYGKIREEKSAVIRNESPFSFVFSGNFLINKHTFLSLNIPDINVYGMDIYFSYLLKKNNIEVFHIDNEIIHLGLEDNNIFLNKSIESITYRKNHWLDISEIYSTNKLIYLYKKLNIFPINSLLKITFQLLNKTLKKQLLKPKPYIWLFDIYRLLYLFK